MKMNSQPQIDFTGPTTACQPFMHGANSITYFNLISLTLNKFCKEIEENKNR